MHYYLLLCVKSTIKCYGLNSEKIELSRVTETKCARAYLKRRGDSFTTHAHLNGTLKFRNIGIWHAEPSETPSNSNRARKQFPEC